MPACQRASGVPAACKRRRRHTPADSAVEIVIKRTTGNVFRISACNPSHESSQSRRGSAGEGGREIGRVCVCVCVCVSPGHRGSDDGEAREGYRDGVERLVVRLTAEKRPKDRSSLPTISTATNAPDLGTHGYGACRQVEREQAWTGVNKRHPIIQTSSRDVSQQPWAYRAPPTHTSSAL